MGNSKHIFIQIDTASITALGKTNPTNEEVRAHTIINDQGSMALGNSVKAFTIYVESNQELHFSILPLELFSYDKLYFTGFEVSKDQGIELPQDLPVNGHLLGFEVPISAAKPEGSAVFCLNAILEPLQGDPIKICIDPKLQTSQGGG